MDTTVTHLQTTPGRPGHCTILHATCYIIATCMYMYMYVHVACCSLLMVKSDTSHFAMIAYNLRLIDCPITRARVNARLNQHVAH